MHQQRYLLYEGLKIHYVTVTCTYSVAIGARNQH